MHGVADNTDSVRRTPAVRGRWKLSLAAVCISDGLRTRSPVVKRANTAPAAVLVDVVHPLVVQDNQLGVFTRHSRRHTVLCRGVVLEKKWGTPETRLRQSCLNSLGLHTRTLIHVRKIATADL